MPFHTHAYAVAVTATAAALLLCVLVMAVLDSTSLSRHVASRRRARRRQSHHPRPPSSSPRASPLPSPRRTELRILSWNVFMRPDVVEDAQELRGGLIANYLAAQDADVIVLQEVFSAHAREMVSRLRMMGWYWRSTALSGGPTHLADGGVVILSRVPASQVSRAVFQHRVPSSSDALAAKGVVHMALRCSSATTLHVFGTHLQAGWGEKCESVRRSQMREVERFIARCAPRSGAAVLCGDFNAPPSSACVASLRGFALAAGTRDDATHDPMSNYLVGCDGDGADIFERSPMFPCLRGCQRSQLDYFLVRPTPQVAVTASPSSPLRPLAPHPYPFRLGFTRQLSDHYPVVATAVVLR